MSFKIHFRGQIYAQRRESSQGQKKGLSLKKKWSAPKAMTMRNFKTIKFDDDFNVICKKEIPTN